MTEGMRNEAAGLCRRCFDFSRQVGEQKAPADCVIFPQFSHANGPIYTDNVKL